MSRSIAPLILASVALVSVIHSCGHSKDDEEGGFADATTSNGQTDGAGNVDGNQAIGKTEQKSEPGDPDPTQQPPTALAGTITFEDFDTDFEMLEGDLVFAKATDETDISHYVVYWGGSETTKLSQTPIQTVAKTGSDITVNLPADTLIPVNASHFLVYSKNHAGESSIASALNITELVETSIAITTGADDWHWEESGATFSSGGLTLAVDVTNNYEVGLRFQNVMIPNSATIDTAYLRVVFTSLATNSVTIRGHDADTGGSCTTALECDGIGASATTANAVWGPLDSNTTGILLPSVEIKQIISEITTRPGWDLGHTVTILLTNPSGSGVTNIASFEHSFQKSELF